MRAHVPKAAAQRRLRLGRALRHLPCAEAAWLSGDLGAAQVSALAQARTPATEEAMARDEEMLVAQATKLRYDAFARALAYWGQWADPDGVEETAWAAPAMGIGDRPGGRNRGAFAYRTYDCVPAGPTERIEAIDVLVANGLNAQMRAKEMPACLPSPTRCRLSSPRSTRTPRSGNYAETTCGRSR